MERYKPQVIEKKWQQIWEEKQIFKTPDKSGKPKYYCLVMFPYSSGDLHIGHWYNFAPSDAFARFKRMNGYNVMHPIGFDSFGLPAENAAIKNKVHPHEWTEENIERMTGQIKATGNSYDWSRVIAAHRPDYYRWTQWMFLLMYKKGLAYRAKSLANWCPECQTVLANEQVEKGRCWRCGEKVLLREIEQWAFKITNYADRLLKDLKKLDWPEKTLLMQKNWIGRSEGLEIDFAVEGCEEKISVFTTRVDTIFGVTFMVLAPEHPVVAKLLGSRIKEINDYVEKIKNKTELERKEAKEKTGVFTGWYAINPLSKEKIPIYISDYILMTYGTGAIMGVPSHDRRDYEFVKKHKLPLRTVIETKSKQRLLKDGVFEDYGILINSGNYTGISSEEAIKSISKYVVNNKIGTLKINYHLRNWVVSRQRYWGAPIPIIYCEKCGIVPVPETDIPVLLPYDVDYTPHGISPLGTSQKFVNTICPKCGGKGKRETDTMDTFVDSSWYFLRYPSARSELSRGTPFVKELTNYWLPVDTYIGGAEHTVLHLLYSRFFTKVLFDQKLISFDEPFIQLRHQGIILGPDGHRMSKSRGNVVNPDDLVETYGSDTVRTYLAFMGPYDQGGPWNSEGIEGVYRFLNRVWSLISRYIDNRSEVEEHKLSRERLKFMHKTIEKVTKDINILHFNTSVSSLMKWLNFLQDQNNLSEEEVETYLLLLSPLVPHLTEELWHSLGNEFSVHLQSWPECKEEYLAEEETTIVVQVNGKLRDRLIVASDISEKEVKEKARNSGKIRKYLENKEISKEVYIPHKLINFVTS